MGKGDELPLTQHLPFPPLELATRVLRIHSDEDPYLEYDFIGSGTRAMLDTILPAGFSYEGRRMLDFGCGAGRTLRHYMKEAESAEFWGVDIDERSIEWLQANLCPPLNVAKGDVRPPLPFADNFIDFAWAISVFTHLPDTSPEWLLELHRVLKPDGLLMVSYMGEHNSVVLAGEVWDENRVGFNVLEHDRPWDEGGPMVMMSEWWVREHWGRAFEIVRIVPEVHNQSWCLMRKKDVKLTVDELMAPSDDPREFAAMRHNLEQVQREVERVRAALGAELAEERRKLAGIETSLSWRSTAWLRRLKARARD